MTKRLPDRLLPKGQPLHPFLWRHCPLITAAADMPVDGFAVIQSDGHPGRVSCAHAAEFLEFRDLNGDVRKIALELHQVGAGGGAAVHPKRVYREAGVPPHQLHQVRDLAGDAVQASPGDLRPARRASDSGKQPLRPAVPVGSAQPGEGGDEAGVVVWIGFVSQLRGLGVGADESYALPQSGHDRPRVIQIALKDIFNAAVYSPGEAGHQPGIGKFRLAANVHHDG